MRGWCGGQWQPCMQSTKKQARVFSFYPCGDDAAWGLDHHSAIRAERKQQWHIAHRRLLPRSKAQHNTEPVTYKKGVSN